MTPAGLRKKRLAPSIDELIVPSIDEGLPLVTLARMFCTLAGPVKVADCELFRLNWLKLSKRLPPFCLPKLAGIMQFGPGNGTLGPPPTLRYITTPPRSG